MPGRSNIVRRTTALFEEGRVDEWVARFTHDAEIPALALAGSEALYRGADGLRRWYGEVAASDTQLRVVEDEFIEVDDLVVVVGKVVVDQGPGRGFGSVAGWVYAFEGDLVRRVDVYPHPDLALAAAGLEKSARPR